MTRALAEQQPTQSHALAGGAQPCGLQHLIDVMPRAAGQRRLVSSRAHGGVVRVVVMIGCVVDIQGRTRTRTSAILVEYKGNCLRCKFFATRTWPRLRGTLPATAELSPASMLCRLS